MRNLKTWIIFIIGIPLLSLLIWLFNSHTLAVFNNLLFSVSILTTCGLFIVLIVQEGVFDATSYGFRRLRYQLSPKKKRLEWENDEFMNPKSPKKAFYIVKPWVKIGLIISVVYVIISIIISLTF
ncbi:DUF3899 domain-containing protein [Staphylococcus massiliensis]|uniref:DUF3899 domain-containing protein n=1 Tax=Staphylococcus massiliensis TaxID=555791 RepID=UPI001EDF2E40|nr:DUF3899 domain-containing protein [Staphylococcus massiliensis]MCG3401612.1 DUF3899 domain-containing protein [Staphylococcus massiliensis]